MAIPVKHTIRIEEVHAVQAVPQTHDLYRNMGLPPRFHVICSCQWAGWTHQQWRAESWAQGHANNEMLRGNPVEVIGLPKPSTAVDASPFQAGETITAVTTASTSNGLPKPPPVLDGRNAVEKP